MLIDDASVTELIQIDLENRPTRKSHRLLRSGRLCRRLGLGGRSLALGWLGTSRVFCGSGGR